MRHATSNLPHDMPETFAELNDLHRLRPIIGKVALDNATEVMDRLAVIDKLTEDQSDYLDTLTLLVEKFESENDEPIDLSDISGVEVLKHILDANGMPQNELAKVLNVSAATVSMILSGERPIAADHARALGKHFAVDAGLFIHK